MDSPNMTVDTIVQFEQLRTLIDARVQAIFKIFNRLRREMGLRVLHSTRRVPADNKWLYIIHWNVVPFNAPNYDISVEIGNEDRSKSYWSFPATLLYCKDEELECVVTAEYLR